MTSIRVLKIVLRIALITSGIAIFWYISWSFGYYAHPSPKNVDSYITDIYLKKGPVRMTKQAEFDFQDLEKKFGKVSEIKISKDWWAWYQTEMEIQVRSTRNGKFYQEGFTMSDLGLVTGAYILYGPITD